MEEAKEIEIEIEKEKMQKMENAFNYMITSLVLVYIRTREKNENLSEEECIDLFNEKNDFNAEKIAMLVYLVCLSGGQKRYLLKVFEYKFCPNGRGIIQYFVFTKLNHERSYGVINIIEGKTYLNKDGALAVSASIEKDEVQVSIDTAINYFINKMRPEVLLRDADNSIDDDKGDLCIIARPFGIFNEDATRVSSIIEEMEFAESTGSEIEIKRVIQKFSAAASFFVTKVLAERHHLEGRC